MEADAHLRGTGRPSGAGAQSAVSPASLLRIGCFAARLPSRQKPWLSLPGPALCPHQAVPVEEILR